ncbi:hypothetical protein MSAN_00540200 [Mycena sanguinolenta]|uniref:Uncharacterized protein n=1 Tax=Mycena sanguinolenta TaxID=230812 RepID=A0A8H6Z9U4_9AGAR|nr:hypothetical protein MSAN_00540200 [Mycena sanguinolenta]
MIVSSHSPSIVETSSPSPHQTPFEDLFHGRAAMEKTLRDLQAWISATATELETMRVQLDERRSESLREQVEVWRRIVDTSEFAVFRKDIIEKDESISRCLHAYNDIIFDVKRIPSMHRPLVMQSLHMKTLKDNQVDSITKLFKKLPNNKPSLKLARDAAVKILAPKERKLCEILINALGEGYIERNDTPPDISTALKRMATIEDMSPELYQVLEAFMQTGPCRMRREGEKGKPKAELKLFAAPGAYRSVEVMREELEGDKIKLAGLEKQLAKEEEGKRAKSGSASS